MRCLLKISGFILILMVMLSFEFGYLSSSDLFTVREAEAFGRRHRHFDTAAEAQTTTQSTETEVETESDEPQDQPVRRRSRHTRTQDSSTEQVSQRTGAPAASVPIGTVVQKLPGGCKEEIFNGVSYSSCGETYYRAAFQGSNLVYVTVDKPQQ